MNFKNLFSKHISKNLALLIIAMLLTTCSGEKTDQALLEADQKALNEALESDKVLVYKLIKVSVRDRYTKKSEIPATNTLLKTMHYSLDQINEGASEVDISWQDWIKAYREYNALKSYAINVDEDQFPTLLDNLIAIYTNSNLVAQNGDSPLVEGWTSDIEHSALSFLTLPAKGLGKEIALYEASKTNTENMADGSWKAGFLSQRGIIYSLEGLYYLSESALTKSITWLDANPNAAFPFIRVVYRDKPLSQKDTWLGVHAANYLYRGIDRMMMEREVDHERAIDDFESFLKDCKQLGWNDELIWIIQAYVGMKRDDHPKAIAALQQLKTSALFDKPTKEAIEQTITYLNEKDPDSALNGVYDKVFITKLITKYVMHKLSEVDWNRVLQENNVPQAEKIIAFNNFIKKQGEVLDQLTSVGQMKDKGKEWLNKAKDLVQ